MIATLVALALCAAASTAGAAPQFIDHGVPVPAAENRGVVAMTASDGTPVVIACSWGMSTRGWILVTDLRTGDTQQIWCPEGISNQPPYAAVVSVDNTFWTSEGPTILEFDPAKMEWTLEAKPVPGETAYLGFTEAPDGLIWAGSYPGCYLVSCDPVTREVKSHGQMDTEQMYMSTLAVDDAGWVYCGIGSARRNLIAYHPKTGERRQLIDEAGRDIGYWFVQRAADGNAYARIAGKSDRPVKYYRLWDGEATAIAESEMGRRTGKHFFWDNIRSWLPDGRTLTNYSLTDRFLEIKNPKTGDVQRIEFDYESEGADLRLIIPGPGGLLYGCSSHPSRACTFDPATNTTRYLPGASAWKGMVVHGDLVMASQYQLSKLFIYDTSKPWQRGGPAEDQNPLLAASFAPDINAPGPLLVHPDGRYVVMCGLPGYGHRGGGLGIYDLDTGETQLLEHTDLIPEHSTVAMVSPPEAPGISRGDILATTSVSGGHGTESAGGEAALYLLDWTSKQITFQTTPVPGAMAIRGLQMGPDGLAYGIANPAIFFVFDPVKRETVYRYDLTPYGGLGYTGFTLGDDGLLYAVMTGAILRITPGTFIVEKLADTPKDATGGIAIQDGRLYFIVKSHLWSYELP